MEGLTMDDFSNVSLKYIIPQKTQSEFLSCLLTHIQTYQVIWQEISHHLSLCVVNVI